MAKVPLEFPNPIEHRRRIAKEINDRGGRQVPRRFDAAREHRRRLATSINALDAQPAVPAPGGVLEADLAIATTSTFGAISSLESQAPPTFFDTGLRRLHCSQVSAAPLDGQTPDLTFTDLQAAIDATIPGDVLTIAAERFTGSFDFDNKAGTPALPIWISAEVRGGTVITNLLEDVRAGTETWQDDGSGVFSIAGTRPYIGSDLANGDFLPGYDSVADINATSIPTDTGPNNPSGSIDKPQRGFAFSGGRISLKVAGGVDPTGRSIALTDGFSQNQMTMDNADNCILDGILFEGAGDTFALIINPNCANAEIRNCVFDYCQFGIRADADNVLIKRCEYLTTGMEGWQRELRTLNGQGTNAAFRYAKNYYNAGNILGNGNFNDALLEGGLDTSEFNGTPADDIVLDECFIHDCFDGSKGGRHRNVEIKNSVFETCLDDGFEMETASSSTGGQFGTSEVHDCLFKNCFSPASYQGNFTHFTSHFYRNIVVIDDLDLVHPPFMLKMINTPGDVNVNIYQNIFINPSADADSNEGFGGNHWVWFAFSNSTANRIQNFFNNIVIFENDLDQTFVVGVLPQGRSNNVVVSPANNTASAQVQGTNGVFAGTAEADMDLNVDFTLQASSPARGAGKSLVGGLPDSRVSNDDAGVFPFGEVVPADWPREASRAFDEGLPDRWPSPGI